MLGLSKGLDFGWSASLSLHIQISQRYPTIRQSLSVTPQYSITSSGCSVSVTLSSLEP